jgi:hypothetical protein
MDEIEKMHETATTHASNMRALRSRVARLDPLPECPFIAEQFSLDDVNTVVSSVRAWLTTKGDTAAEAADSHESYGDYHCAHECDYDNDPDAPLVSPGLAKTVASRTRVDADADAIRTDAANALASLGEFVKNRSQLIQDASRAAHTQEKLFRDLRTATHATRNARKLVEQAELDVVEAERRLEAAKTRLAESKAHVAQCADLEADARHKSPPFVHAFDGDAIGGYVHEVSRELDKLEGT